MTPKEGKKRAEKAFVASWEKDTQKKAMHMQRMSQRNEQLERIRRRYAGRGKEGKSHLLDEFCEQYGYERKYAIKLNRCRKSSNGSGTAPNTSAANGWPQPWNCGCLIMPGTMDSSYLCKRSS